MPSNNNQELDDDTMSIISNIDFLDAKKNNYLKYIGCNKTGTQKDVFFKQNEKNGKKYAFLKDRDRQTPLMNKIFSSILRNIFRDNEITPKDYPATEKNNLKIFDDTYAYNSYLDDNFFLDENFFGERLFIKDEVITKHITRSDNKEDRLLKLFIALGKIYYNFYDLSITETDKNLINKQHIDIDYPFLAFDKETKKIKKRLNAIETGANYFFEQMDEEKEREISKCMEQKDFIEQRYNIPSYDEYLTGMIKGCLKYTTLYSQVVENGKIDDLDNRIKQINTFFEKWFEYRTQYLTQLNETIKHYKDNKTLNKLQCDIAKFIQDKITQETKIITTIQENIKGQNYLKNKVVEYIKKINQVKNLNKKETKTIQTIPDNIQKFKLEQERKEKREKEINERKKLMQATKPVKKYKNDVPITTTKINKIRLQQWFDEQQKKKKSINNKKQKIVSRRFGYSKW